MILPTPLRRRSWRAALLLALLALAPASGYAQRCGDTLTADTTLSSDLHCTSGWTALTLARPGITLHLNGKTLSGTSRLVGIDIFDMHGVVIRGPGRIEGFWAGVRGSHAHGLRVANLDFTGVGAGIVLNHSESVRIEGNGFTGIHGEAISLLATGPALAGGTGNHVIVHNLISKGGSGISLCGRAQSDSLIEGNTLEYLQGYGLNLQDGSGGHRVHGNRFAWIENTDIFVQAGSGNDISSNKFRHGRLAIGFSPQTSGICGASGSADIHHNRVQFNHVYKHETAFVLGSDETETPVQKNWIQQNRIEAVQTGIYFRRNAQFNEARSNVFPDTPVPVIDEGAGNLY